MIWRMNCIIFICRLTCENWLPSSRGYGSDNCWALEFELDLSVGMVLGSPIGYPLKYWIRMVLGFVIGKLIWHTRRILGFIFTWNTGWLDDRHLWRIFRWIITGISIWIPNWISKYWSRSGFVFWISDWHDTWDVSWKLSWIHDSLYLEYQLVWYLAWRFNIPLILQLGRLFFLLLTWNL